jgi:hypothetical protein
LTTKIEKRKVIIMPENYGAITVRVYTAGGGLPVEGALVRITGAEEINRQEAHSRITDRNGIAQTVFLPAPGKISSSLPNPSEAPYYIYDVSVEKEGYYTRRIQGVSVFPAINSIQPVNMIPIGNGTSESYPRGNLDITIPDNTTL